MIKKIITIGLLLGTINTSIASIQITKDFIKFPDGSNQVKAMPNPTGEDNKVLTSNGASAEWIEAAANRVGDEVKITTNGKTWTFQKDGKLIGPDGTEIGGGGYTGGASIAETGYQILPSGLIMQWGRKSVPGNSNTTVTLPITFPNDLFTLHGTPNDNRASNDFEVDHYSVACKDTGSLSSFTIMSEGTSAGTMTIFWQALGN